jgi:hypothetical protein
LQAAFTTTKRTFSLLAGREVHDVHGHQGFQRAGGVVAGDAQLAHVGDVEERRRFPALPVFGNDAARVVDRHVVAGERHHLGAQFHMQGMQGGLQQIGSGHVSLRGHSGTNALSIRWDALAVRFT